MTDFEPELIQIIDEELPTLFEYVRNSFIEEHPLDRIPTDSQLIYAMLIVLKRANVRGTPIDTSRRL